MNRKIILIVGLLIVLIIAGGIFYWWWEAGKQLREINRDLPEGVRVGIKNGQQIITNERDGYEIVISEKWGELERVQHSELHVGPIYREEGIKEIAVIALSGLLPDEEEATSFFIDKHKFEKGFEDMELRAFIEINPLWLLGPAVIVEEKKVGDFETLRIIKEFEWGNSYYYFFKVNSTIYSLAYMSEDLIREVILNSRWSL